MLLRNLSSGARLRSTVRRALLLLTMTLLWPTVAQAASGPASCDRSKWNDAKGRSGAQALLETIDIRSPETTAFTFDCVLGYAFDGPQGDGRLQRAMARSGGSAAPATGGITLNIIRNLMGLAWALLGLMWVLEFCYIGLFAPDRAAEEMIGSMIRLVLTALVLQSYESMVVPAFREIAVDGSIGAQKLVERAGAAPSPAQLAVTGSIRDQLRMKLAQAEALRRRKLRGDSLTTSEQTQLRLIEDTTNPDKCHAAAAQLSDAQGSARAQEAAIACAMIPAQQQFVKDMMQESDGVMDAEFSPMEMLAAWAAKGAAKTVSVVVEFVVAGALICVSACIALAFAMVMAIGPLCLPFMAFRKSATIGNWWFKNALGTALLPVVLAAAMGLYSGTAGYIVSDATNDSPIMILVSSLLAVPLLGIAIKGGFGLIERLGGGMATVGMDMAKGAAKLGVAAATGGVAGAANGGGLMGALKGGLGAVADAGAAVGGSALNKGGKDESGAATRGLSSIARSAGRSLTRRPSDTIAAGMQRARDFTSTAAEQGGAAPSLETPTGALSPMEQRHAEARAGADLAGLLGAGDYTRGAGGQLALSAAGRRKVAEYRQTNRAALRSLGKVGSEQDFVNTGSIGARIAGGGTASEDKLSSLYGTHDGSAERSIAEQLPSAMTAPRPGEQPAQTKQRVDAVVARIRQQSGGSWARAASIIEDISRQSRRTAVGSDNGQYGITPDTVGAPASARQYTAESGSAFAAMRQSHPRSSPEKLYTVCRDTITRAHKAELAALSPEAAEEEINRRIFTKVQVRV